jgi:hypothetical protein
VSALRRLRILHMGGNLEGPDAQEQQGERLEATLRPLRNLQVGRCCAAGALGSTMRDQHA